VTRTFWDERFAGEGIACGEKPNGFLREQLDRLAPGSLLLPAEGEGRNAVRAAARGWEVLAFGTSTVGRDKALTTARRGSVPPGRSERSEDGRDGARVRVASIRGFRAPMI